VRTKVIAGSQQWHQITLSQQWTLDTMLPFLLFLSKSDLSPQCLWAIVISEVTCWCYHSCCGIKNTFGISVYSKEYTFPILFSKAISHRDNPCMSV
jgi:hypothetical protein